MDDGLRVRWLTAGAALLIAVALAACGPEDGAEADSPLTVYLSVPLSGAGAAEGQRIEAAARAALDAAQARAGAHPIELVVLDDAAATGARSSPVATGANARRASEDADAIAYIGDVDPEAMLTSAPITDLSKIPQVALSDPPRELEVENMIVPGELGDGAAAMKLVLEAVEAAGEDAGDRTIVRDELRDLASGAAD